MAHRNNQEVTFDFPKSNLIKKNETTTLKNENNDVVQKAIDAFGSDVVVVEE
jgi:hypothetical protein